jgi:ATP-dependent DNA helicase PIF1
MELCTYCMLSPPEYDRIHQLICCHPRHHIVTYADMLDEDGERHKSCNECRSLGFPSSAPVPSQSSHSDPSSFNRPLSSQGLSQFLSTDPFASSQAPRGRGHADLGAAYRNRQAKLDAFIVRDLPLDLFSEEWRDDPALPERDYQLLNKFHEKLHRERFETCSHCEEKWFHMGLDDNRVCTSCQKADKNLDEDNMPFLYSGANEMDPGPMPPSLEQLTHIEKMLIARVHCFVEVRQVRGVQYKYKGHIVNFLTNTSKVYNRLPLLAEDVDTITIRPFNWNKDPRMRRQFCPDTKVRKHVIKAWLLHPKTHHPGYRDLEISHDNLDALPHEFFADEDLIVYEIENKEVINASDIGIDDEEEQAEVGAAPDLTTGRREFDAIYEQLQSQGARRIGRQPRRLPSMSMPTPQQTRISEYQRKQGTLSLAFPGLYPYGRFEYLTPRAREVKYTDYVRHLLLYRDMRFAQHPRFRYVAFNTIMRHQINEKAGFFVRKLDPQNKDLSLDDLRNAFNDDTEDSRAILNRVTRYAASLRGTRPYWSGRMKMVEAMVRMLGCPSLFLTFSAADLHWNSLMRHLPRYEEWKAAPSDERVRIARENLHDNPHIVAYHFYRRLQVFTDEVLRDKFNIRDLWNRFE